MNQVIDTLKANKWIVIGGVAGLYAAPTVTNMAAKALPAVTGTKLGKIGLNVALGGLLLALGSGDMVKTTAAVAASIPFFYNAVESGIS